MTQVVLSIDGSRINVIRYPIVWMTYVEIVMTEKQCISMDAIKGVMDIVQ